VCRNHALAAERRRKREELLRDTEAKLNTIVEATQRDFRPLRGRDKIGTRLGRVLARSKVAKHFRTTITDNSFAYERDQDRISQEALLDGFYVVRTPVAVDDMAPEQVVRCYKNLSTVEQAFRLMKSIDLRIRPIFHWREDRVRSHAFLCMLAYYVDWHMRRDLAPLLFEDDDPEGAEACRESVVAKAQPSPSAQSKATTKRTPDGLPVQSFATLLEHLATIAINQHQSTLAGFEDITFFKLTELDRLSQRAFELIGVKPSV
jgi:transposase